MMRDFTEKQYKKIRTSIGITVAVYLSFKYLLPLVVPFLLAGLLAWILYPCIRYLHYRFPIIKESLWASFLLLIIGAILVLASWILFMKFGSLVGEYANKIDFYWNYFWQEIENRVSQLEIFLGLKNGSLVMPINQMAVDLGDSIRNKIATCILPGTLECAKSFVRFSAGFFVMVIATVLVIEEKESLKERCLTSSFYMEARIVLDNLRQTGGAYLKVQSLILAITITLCSIGFWILKMKHPIIKGVAIGIFDALPIFGTGTIFIPWIIILLFKGQILRAIEIGALYLVCYFVRECMENHMMGKSMGITALEFLISVYVGLKLFGGAGFLLGPIGYLIIRLGGKMF